MKILHIADPQTFTTSFFHLVEKEFEHAQHCILSHAAVDEWPKNLKIKNKNSAGLGWFLEFIWSIYRADKVIIHGLFNSYAIVLLALQPWLLKKSYWMIWGGDLYAYEFGHRNWKWKLKEFFRRPVIKRMGHLVTYVDGDVELARNWYGATGRYHECIMYTSNIYREYAIKSEPHGTINIQIGNSADSSNNHLEILEKLAPFRDQNIAIYAPLSYGSQEYAQSVINMGRDRFGDKFKPITDFIPFDQYLDFLGKIDIAIFNHKRQQAMGNIITLLGLGKKVYMRSDITPWAMFKKKGVKIYESSAIELSSIDERSMKYNREAIRSNFSEEIVIKQLKKIFEE